MKKKIAAIITCFVMAMAFMPTFAFAADAQADTPSRLATPLHYVSFGDADAAGIGMDVGAKEFGAVTPGTYPALLKSDLEQRGFSVTLDQMAMEHMRIEELRYLLDNNYGGDAYQKENFKDLSKMREDYQAAVKDADLITCRIGTVNFGSYLLDVAKDVDKNCNDPAINALVETDPDGIVAEYEQALQGEADKIPSGIKNMAKQFDVDIDVMLEENSDKYIKAAAYVYYSACYNYDKTIQLIREKNPDATLIILGLDNMLDDLAIGLKLTNTSGVVFTLNIGSLYNEHVIQNMNVHLKGMQGISAYVDCSDTKRFLEEAKDYDGNVNSITQQFKDYCDVYEDDLMLARDKEAKLGSNKTKQAKGMDAAYDTAAASMKSIAATETFELSVTDIQNRKDEFKDIAGIGSNLMKGLHDKCWENASLAANNKGYKSSLANYVNGELYGEKPAVRSFNKVVMAVGIRALMGDGFFQHPSAVGHDQIRTAIMNACAKAYLHVLPQEQTCTLDGVKVPYWQNLSTGKCYTDAAYTQEVPLSACRDLAPGHAWGEPVEVDPADVGVPGQSKVECTKCDAVDFIVIPAKNPAGAKISKVTGAKKALTVKWAKSKDASKITGYELRYSLKSSMAGAKTVKASKSSVSKKITKLQAKKKYYVQIRAYKKSADGTMYYSGWSAKKSGKTKK